MDLMDYRRKIIANSPHLSSASGAVVSFADGADNLPLKSLNVDIEPVQDLHGYDYPWVAGGGKNKLNQDDSDRLNVETSVYGASDSKIVAQLNTLSAGTYTISLKAKITSLNEASAVPTSIGLHLRAENSGTNLNVACTKAQYTPVVGEVNSINKTFTLTEDYVGKFTAAYVYTGKNTNVSPEVKYTGIVYDVQLESGSTATAWSPYENICPISGWNGVKVTRTGKNLLDNVSPSVINAYISNLNGVPILRANAENRTVIVQIKKNTTYTYTWNQSAKAGASADDSNIILFDEYPVADVTLGYSTGGNMDTANNKRTFNSEGYKYAAIKIANTSRSNFEETLSASMLEVGSTATPYEPYNGVTVTIQLGQTVYGGTLNPLTGVLTVDMQIITGNANWGIYWNNHKAEQVDTNKRASFMLSLTNETVYAQRASAKCNMLIHDTVVLNGLGNKSAFCLHPTLGRYLYACLPLDTLGMSSATSATSDADFRNAIKAMGDNLQIVIPLATPVEIQLTPQQIRSLYGNNTIFAATGNVALEYWAHP